MAAVSDSVVAMQADVLGKTDEIFAQIEGIVQDATGKALQADISASLSGSFNVTEPPFPEADMTIADAIAYIDGLKRMMLFRPTYPAMSVVPPTDPTVDTNLPDLPDVNIPEKPDITIPTFDATMPDIDVVLPSAQWNFEESPYLSSLSERLYQVLYTDISRGDYGLDPQDEDRIFNRARERELIAMQNAVQESTRLHALGGFTAPTGAAQRSANRISNLTVEKISSVNRDLAIKKAELYSDHKKHELDLSATLEKILRDYHSQVNERRLKAATEQITATLAIAGFQIERIKAFIERYKALALVFETKAKVEMTKAEIFKAEAEVVKAEVDANRAVIDAFIARNKAIIDVFLGEVEGYKARVDAWAKHIGGLADLYKADASALGAMADGYGKAFDASSRYVVSNGEYLASVMNARVAEARGKLDAAIQKAQIELEGEKTEANVAAMVASAALSALNVNASVGADANSNMSYTGSRSEQEGTFYNYNYSGQM